MILRQEKSYNILICILNYCGTIVLHENFKTAIAILLQIPREFRPLK